ncbi:MAG: type II toxin-antitoxin system HicA family toxin [Thermoplasmatota archaeon]
MGRVIPLPYRKVARLLREHGFEIVRLQWSHAFFLRTSDGRTTVVPNPPGRDIPPGLVRKILADAGIDVAEL